MSAQKPWLLEQLAKVELPCTRPGNLVLIDSSVLDLVI